MMDTVRVVVENGAPDLIRHVEVEVWDTFDWLNLTFVCHRQIDDAGYVLDYGFEVSELTTGWRVPDSKSEFLSMARAKAWYSLKRFGYDRVKREVERIFGVQGVVN